MKIFVMSSVMIMNITIPNLYILLVVGGCKPLFIFYTNNPMLSYNNLSNERMFDCKNSGSVLPDAPKRLLIYNFFL